MSASTASTLFTKGKRTTSPDRYIYREADGSFRIQVTKIRKGQRFYLGARYPTDTSRADLRRERDRLEQRLTLDLVRAVAADDPGGLGRAIDAAIGTLGAVGATLDALAAALRSARQARRAAVAS